MLGKSVVAQSLKKWGKHADLVDSPVEIGNPTCIMSYNSTLKIRTMPDTKCHVIYNTCIL